MARHIAIFLRHGDYHQLLETPSALQPFPLNEAGEGHATAAIELVSSMVDSNGWTLHPVIHCSSLLRAWQTATRIADGRGKGETVLETDQLVERALGSGGNLSLTQLRKVIDQDPRYESLPEDWKSNSHFRLPLMGAESLMEAGKRVADYVSLVLDQLPDDQEQEQEQEQEQAVLFVGHGAAFRHAAHHLGVMTFEDIAKLSMYHARPVALARGDGDRWALAAGQWKIRAKAEKGMD